MTAAPSRPCRKPGCSGFAAPGSRHCVKCEPAAIAEVAAQRAVHDERRGTAAERGYGGQWPATARRLRQRCPLSPGYLTRTAFWTPLRAEQFHTLREQAIAAGRYLEFLRGSAELPEVGFIYEFHASPVPEPSECVDHIVPVAGPADPLFYAESNHQPISNRQHSEKTARFDGGFRGSSHVTRHSSLH